jgi:hypothetical protein
MFAIKSIDRGVGFPAVQAYLQNAMVNRKDTAQSARMQGLAPRKPATHGLSPRCSHSCSKIPPVNFAPLGGVMAVFLTAIRQIAMLCQTSASAQAAFKTDKYLRWQHLRGCSRHFL